jgi:hypothetical protein
MKMKEIAKPADVARAAGAPEARTAGFSVYESLERALDGRSAATTTVNKQLPNAVYGLFIACWAVLFGVFVAVFQGNAQAFFNLSVVLFTGLMFFGVPIVISRAGPKKAATAPGLIDFLRGKFDTLTGPIAGVEALAQVLLVPVCLTLGAIAIAYILHEDYVEVLQLAR